MIASTLYLFGSPLVGLLVLAAIVLYLFKRGRRTQSQQLSAIALALCIAGICSVGMMVYAFLYVLNVGSWAGLILIGVPLYGLYSLLSVFPLAWAIITLFLLFFCKHGKSSEHRKVYERSSMAFSLLIVLVYVGIGATAWRQHWQYNLLYDEKTSPKDVMSVYGDGKWRGRSGLDVLAKRSYCPAALLAELVVHDDHNVRSTVAANPNTPIPSLETLANDPNPSVRMGILFNKNSPPNIIRTVAATEFKIFPTMLFVKNPNTSEDVLGKLDQQEIVESNSIRRVLAKHRNIPAHLALILAKTDDGMTIYGLAENPSCPVDILKELATTSSDPNVVCAVASNPSSSQDIVKIIAQAHGVAGRIARKRLSKEDKEGKTNRPDLGGSK